MKIKYLGVVVFSLACAACSSGMNAIINTAQDAFRGYKEGGSPSLNPDFRFLRVAIQGRVVFLALGNEDAHPLGPIEVWYSAEKEVLRLQNGRIVGATGLTTEWRSVVLNAPPLWSAAMGAAQPLQWVRMRDVMPGYRFGVRDHLELRPILPPKSITVQGRDSQRLSWFEERVLPSAKGTPVLVAADQILPPARYAVDMQEGRAVVVYSEQCLASELCFAWQRWKP